MRTRLNRFEQTHKRAATDFEFVPEGLKNSRSLASRGMTQRVRHLTDETNLAWKSLPQGNRQSF